VRRRSRGERGGRAREATHHSCGAGREGSTVTIRGRPLHLSSAPLELQGRERGCGDLTVPLFRAAGQGGREDRALNLRCRSPRSEAIVAVPDCGDGG
jgi:hypothetical protein